jgi:hypothetical protein
VIAAPSPVRSWVVRLTISAFILVSLAFFLAEVYGLFSMTLLTSFGPLPLMVLLVGIASRMSRGQGRELWRRLLLGLAIGFIATLAYDAIRWVAYTGLQMTFNPFAVHARFGELITDQPRTSTTAIAVGWTYHFWNGITFGAVYALLAGRAPWVVAVVYALMLEALMVAIYPTAWGISRTHQSFLFLSILGHVTYGVVLGLLHQKYVARVPAQVSSRQALT